MSTSASTPHSVEPTAPPASASEADDFLARAQALGLRLTRADYERTRAGVTAFLKAERLPAASPGSSEANDEERKSAATEPCASPAGSEQDPSTSLRSVGGATPALSRWLRTTSGQLSFFTAVVRPMSGTNEEGRARITLDEVGSAEERRRRRARRRRMLEKQMMLESRLARDASPHEPSLNADTHDSHSVADPHSPTRTVRASSVASEAQTPTRPTESVRTSTPLSHVALSESMDSPSSPSPEINVLNRMARMDHAGKLWLAPPESDTELKSEESMVAADDSGVFCDQETSDSSTLRGWGPRAFGRTSSTTENLNACMKSMSLLDRIMMSKTSPQRMRREAKARAREAPETDDDVSAASLSDAPDVSTTSNWADVSSESAPGHVRQSSGSLRQPQDLATPLRSSVHASEQYDFVIQDISPDKPEPTNGSPLRVRSTPLASGTPLTKLDPGAQITPMRYSPGYNLGYSHCRSTSITSMFSPNILTPWSHQGRLMSNAGLTNIASSPNLSGEWMASSSALGSNSVSRSNTMYTSTPLSHLPFGEESHGAGSRPSPSRLLCIESFPGKSPQQRTALSNESPTKSLRHQPASPLTDRSARNARNAPDSPGALSGTVAGRLDLAHRIAPLYEPAWDKIPYRRTDTVSPADLFHPAGAAPWLAQPDPVASDEDDAETPSVRAERDKGAASSRARLSRRTSAMMRSTSAASAMTPAHGDDVFAKTESAKPSPVIHDVFSEPLPMSDANQTEWDKPDGSRVVKLVSEELQAAIDSGTLEHEPEPRYFRLPPGHGSSKAKPSSVSYAGLIGQAILSSSDGRLSLAEIYLWISSVYPYYERGDRGWQNSIRHNLSLNKSFVKLERESSIPGKGGWWAIVPGHESRFQNGVYQPNVARSDPSASRSFKPSHSAPAQILRSPLREACKKRQGGVAASPEPADESLSDLSFKRPKTSRAPRAARPEASETPMRMAPAQNSSSGAGNSHMPVLTDSASSPATSPLQSFAQDGQPSSQQTWRNGLPLYAYGGERSPHKAAAPSHLAPPRSGMGSFVRPLRGASDQNLPMYFGQDTRPYPSTLSPSRRLPLRSIPVAQPPVSGLPSFAHPAYMTCTYPPLSDTPCAHWPESGDLPFGYDRASPSRLGWSHGQ